MKRLMVVPQQLPVEGGGGEEAPVLLGAPDDILLQSASISNNFSDLPLVPSSPAACTPMDNL